ncbi:hypothetical protein QBC38DRAFT_355318 [Podospora fimiseda]|uniref:Uncharacterized protein n=1 Tax=Podospora fimiseda TaxID=252190 RepID=A0AAN7BX26_9PEZI|nr:hypothetical protein QBC38DRAFT_355318 [Podospora fimiseda]
MKQSGEELSLSGLFNKPELGMRILTHLTPSVRDISALALTSKGFSEQVSRLVEFWDIGGDAKDFEVDVASKAANFKFQEDQSGNIIQSGLGIRSGILVITRLTEQDPDPTFKPHYRESFLTSRNLLKTIHDIPNSFKHVVFDQLQYFDTRVFKMLVASLPNLETVSISRCELMDVMKLPKLIEIIKSAGIKRLSQSDATHVEAPADNASDESSTRPGSFGTRAWQEALTNSRASGKKEVKDYIKLDFAPYYFSGPDTKNRLGSFGVTHHQPTFHTPKAVTGLTLMCNADAEEIGMDLWSDSSSYFSFVKRLPGPDRLWATKAREAVMTLKQQTTQDRWIDQAYATRARDQFADDMMAAVSGDNFYPNQVSLSRWKWLCADHHKWGWWRESKRCGDCKYDHLRAFFDLKAGQCWACHMLEFVNDIDDSHARRYQHNTLEIYLRRKRDYENADTLKEFFNHPEYDKWFRRALKSTGLADKAWSYFQFEAEFHDPSGMVAMEPVLPAQPPWYPRSGTAGITVRALAMAHWMWARNEVTQHYDIRKGGPQCRHPCYVAAIYASAAAGGAQGMGTYSQNWTWSPLSRDVWTEHLRTWMHWEDLNPEQRKLGIDGAIKQQIDQLREAWRNGEFPPHIREILVKLEYPIIAEDEIREFIEYKNRIEDCGIGLMTPYQQPFDHDHPFLNQDLDPDFHQKPAEDKLPYRAANRWGVW